MKMRRVVTLTVATLLGLALKAPPQDIEIVPGKIAIIISMRWEDLNVITLSELRRIYLGQMVTFKGETVKPRHRSMDSPIRAAFRRHILRMTEKELEEFYLRERLRGGARPPIIYDSFGASVSYVSKIKGSMAYVDFAKLGSIKNVKVLSVRVENKIIHPSHRDYSLTYYPADKGAD